jgi:parallel beta-helix repeat protein
MARIKVLVLLFISFLIISFSVSSSLATTYYVSSSFGDDSNNGTSQSTPWKTISKVNSRSFSPEDSILLMRGDTWINEPLTVSSSGSQGNVILYGAYGTGNLPKLDGDNQEHWAGLVRINGKNWITIENLEITNVGKECIHISGPSTGVTIQDCEIHKNSYVGYMLIYVDAGGILGNVTQFTLRSNLIYDGLHNGIRLTGGVTYATIMNNTFHTFYHNAIDAYPGSINNSNFTIYGNNMYNAKCGIYLPGTSYSTVYENDIHDDWKGVPASGYDAISYGIKLNETVRAGDHNTIRNNRIWNITTADNNTYAVWVSGSSYNKIYNNTVYACYNPFLNINNTDLDVQNNLAYNCTKNSGGWIYGSNPIFVNPTGTPPDFHLQSSSPCIDKGVDVKLPYIGTAPDLGAYEYNPVGSPPMPPTGLKVLSP